MSMSPLGARDTDRDWERLGAQQPYWSVLSNPAFAGRNEIDGDDRANFFATGEAYVARVRKQLEERLGAPATTRAALDFGCGVGRLLIPMRARSAWAAGVDTAASMRALCLQHLSDAGFSDAPVATSIDEAVAAAPAPIDWINSYIVFQHIAPRRGLRLIEALAAALAPGGALSLHVTAFRDASLMAPTSFHAAARAIRRRFMPAGTVTMYDYDLARVFAILVRAGLGPFLLEHENHGGHHGFIIYARKAA